LWYVWFEGKLLCKEDLTIAQIYRCFIVWNNNYYIIIIPALFLIMSISEYQISGIVDELP